jgi:hypothetical protein
MTETNNALFTVQRSIDGHVFETVGTLPGAGNSTDKRFYNLLDKKPLKETSYYRLMQTDFDGSISYSPLISIHNFYFIKSFQLFPNPASKIVYLFGDIENNSTYNLQLITLEGIELFQAYIDIGTTPYPINIQNLIPGVYILHINSSHHAEQLKLVVTD